MKARPGLVPVLAGLLACSGSDAQDAPRVARSTAADDAPAQPSTAGDDRGSSAPPAADDAEDTTAPAADDEAVTETLPLEPAGRVVFVEPGSGFMTDEVYDADREVVFFDAELGAMVSGETGAVITGWRVDGVDLDWSRFAVPFRVRFGTEDGERRA